MKSGESTKKTLSPDSKAKSGERAKTSFLLILEAIIFADSGGEGQKKLHVVGACRQV